MIAPAAIPMLVDVRIPGIEIEGELGHGAYSVVYRARMGGRACALKVPRKKGRWTQWVYREAVALARVQHPGLPSILEVGEAAGLPYLAMELVEGETLAERLRRGPLGEPATLRLIAELASILEAVHERGLVHRDVKPRNIVLGRGQAVRLIDFGFAMPNERATESELAGTPAYAAPEQFAPQGRVDARSDLYCVGAVACECLAGKLPAQVPDGETPKGDLVAELVDLGVSPSVATLLGGLVAHLPSDRYPDARALQRDVERVRGGQEPLGPSAYSAKRAVGPLVSRDDELEALFEPWRAVKSSGALVVLQGRRGTGKTRLLASFVSETEGVGECVVEARCEENDPPLSILRRILEGTLASIERRPPEQRAKGIEALTRAVEPFAGIAKLVAPRFGALVNGPSAPRDSESIGEAAAELVVRLARVDERMIIVVDDIHRIDLASRDLLTRVAHRLHEVPLMVVVATRDDETMIVEPIFNGARNASSVHLPEMSSRDVSRLVAAHLGQSDADSSLVERVKALADGTPLGVLEVLGAYLDEGTLRPHANTWTFDAKAADTITLPRGALVLLGRRLRELPEATREVLTTAAVIGVAFEDALLARVIELEVSDADFALGQARRAGLLAEEGRGRHRFVHESLREMLVTGLFPEARRDLHFRIAEAIDASGDTRPEAIFARAFHYGAGDLARNPSRAYRAARRAAEAATERYDHQTALGYLRTARRAAAAGGIPLDLVFFRSEAETFLRIGALEESLRSFEAALERARDGISKADIRSRISWVHQTGADPNRAWSELDLAFAAIGEKMPVESVGSATHTLGSFVRGEAKKLFGRHQRRRDAAELELLCSLHYQNSRLGLEYGKPFRLIQSGLEAFELASGATSRRTQARARGLYGAVLTAVGRRDAGAAELEKAHRIAAEADEAVTVAFCIQLRSVAACWAGEFDRALELLADVLDNHGVWCELAEYCFNASNADYIEALRGRCAEGWPWIVRAVDRLRRSPGRRTTGSDWLLLRARATRASLKRDTEDPWLDARIDELLREEPAPGIARMLSWGPRARFFVEGGTLGEGLEEVVRAFEKEGYKPKSVHPGVAEYYIAIAQARLHQCLVDKSSTTARGRLESAIKDLAAMRSFPLLDAHLRLCQGALAWLEGARNPAKLLAEAELLANEHTCPWVLYGVARVRAHMLQKEGRANAARDQARAAELFARDHGATARARWIREEFGLPAPPPSDQPQSMHSSSRARRQLSTLLHLARAPRPELRTEQQASTVLDEILRHLDAARGVVWFQPEPGRRPPTVIGRTRLGSPWLDLEPWHQAIIQRVRDEGTPWPSEADPLRDPIEGADPNRVLAVPLSLYERVAGVICVERGPTSRAFAAEERGILNILAHQVPAALEIARLLVEREEVQATLQHAQKMEAVGQMAGGLAHDFNNMLQAMRASIEAVKEREGSTENTQDLEVLSSAAARATLITEQLLSFSRHQPVAIAPLDVNEAVNTLELMIRRVVGEKIAVTVDLAAEGAIAESERSALDQAIMNIVVNARDAMPNGGSLHMTTRNVELGDEDVRRGIPNAGPYVEIIVKDTGRGMPPETLERIFEPFFTTKPPGAGTGLGLATVYAFTKRCRGHIDVSSVVGQGTTVRMSLRRGVLEKKATPPAPAEVPPSSLSTPTRGTKILVVDDDELILKALGRMLERSGYHVLCAHGGNEALELVRRHGSEIGLVIMDVLMPGMSGPELCRRIADLEVPVKVLFMSGFSPESLPPQASSVKADALLQKPFAPAVLLARVEALLPRVTH